MPLIFRSSMDSKKNWRKKCREYLAAAFGGHCTICGYDKTISALDYHHVDPKSKNEILSIAMRNGYAWSKIVEEAKKCACVCCRCHREIHAGVTDLPENYTRFNEDYTDVVKLRKAEFDKCSVCGEEKYNKKKFCSQDCFHKSQMRFSLTKEKLAELVNEKPYEEIGKMYGVSGNAIKKRCKSFGIDVGNRRGFWSKK